MEAFDPTTRVTGITLSPTAKFLIVATGGVVVGIFLGVSISRILDEVHSDAPHLPTLLHDVAEVVEEVAAKTEIEVSEVIPDTQSLHAVAKELGIDLEEK